MTHHSQSDTVPQPPDWTVAASLLWLVIALGYSGLVFVLVYAIAESLEG